MSIAENLIRLRKAAGLSQTQLAEKSHTSQQLISQIEGGINNTTKHLPALAKALDCKVSDIDESYVEDDTLSDEERDLVKVFRQVPEEQRVFLEGAVRLARQSLPASTPEEPPVRPHSKSAGSR